MAYRPAIPRLLRKVGWIVVDDEFTEIEEPVTLSHPQAYRFAYVIHRTPTNTANDNVSLSMKSKKRVRKPRKSQRRRASLDCLRARQRSKHGRRTTKERARALVAVVGENSQKRKKNSVKEMHIKTTFFSMLRLFEERLPSKQSLRNKRRRLDAIRIWKGAGAALEMARVCTMTTRVASRILLAQVRRLA